MAGKSRQQKKKRAKMQKQINDGLRQKAPNVPKVVEVVTDFTTDEPEPLGNNAEPSPPNVNEDAQKDEAMMKEPFDPKSLVANILKKRGE